MRKNESLLTPVLPLPAPIFAIGSIEFDDHLDSRTPKACAEVIEKMNAVLANGETVLAEYTEPAKNFASARTRVEVIAKLDQACAEVIADLDQAYLGGRLARTEWVEPTSMPAASRRTREGIHGEAA